MRFNLATVAYVFALLAAGMAAFGATGGIVVACLVLAWRYAPPRIGCAVWLIVGLLSLFIPHWGSEHLQVAQQHHCLINLRHIAIGLWSHIVSNASGTLPQAATFGESGKPLHSWRTAILPFLEQRALYSQLALDEAWDSSINRGYTVDMQLEIYRCPAHGTAAATGHYLAVVGERTAWPPGRGRKLSEVTDGTANTVMLIEAPWAGAAWGEPKDLSFDEAVKYLTREPKRAEVAHENKRGFFYKSLPVVHVAMMDGRVRALPLPLPRETAAALLTVDGGEEIDERALDVERAAELDYGRCYAVGAFVMLAAAPAVRLRRRGDRGGEPHGSLLERESGEGSPAAR